MGMSRFSVRQIVRVRMINETAQRRWSTHRQALALINSSVDTPTFAGAVEWLNDSEYQSRLDFLAWHGLSALAAERLKVADILTHAHATVEQNLLAARRTAVAMYMAQCSAWQEVSDALDQKGIQYVVLKGAATREEVYADPALRSMGDIDVLVRARDRDIAIAQLTRLGFLTLTGAGHSAHEITLSRGRVDIDLHWDILRPGRTRSPLVGSLINRRVRGPKAWRLSDTDTVFLMLVHPAFTKYVCSRNMGLNRVVDFLRFVRNREIEWDVVAERLDECGLRTAAWCTLQWIGMLDPTTNTAHDVFLRRIAPGPSRQSYLKQWLTRDWPGRLLGRADWLIQTAFTLPLHDRVSDAWRAVRHRAMSLPVTTRAGSAPA